MAYTINKTDGTILTTVADGQIDNISTDLTLIGKNYSGFGDALNENFIRLLENFAGTAVPQKPIRGQIWFDASELKLKVYNGTSFQPVSSATISDSRPADLAIGDLWFNNIDKQLFFYDGTNTILLGPDYSVSQGLSGLKVDSILDDKNQTRIITSLFVNGVLLGIFSKDTFTPKVEISGFGRSQIIPGFNQSVSAGIKFSVTATNSDRLGNQPAGSYVRNDTSGAIAGSLSIQDSLLVGDADQFQLVIQDGNVTIANIANDKNVKITVRKSEAPEDAFLINTITRSINLYQGFESSQVNVGGSMTIAGNLTLRGNFVINDGSLTTVKTSELVIEDKVIVLAQTGDSSLNSDEFSDEGGMILKGGYEDTDSLSPTFGQYILKDHIFQWSNNNKSAAGTRMALASDAWNSSEHINLEAGKSFKINGVEVLSSTSLGPGITSIPGVTSFGPQVFIQVGPNPSAPILRIEQNRFSSITANTNIEITPNGTGNIVLRQVTGTSYSGQTNVGFPLVQGLATTNQNTPGQVTEHTGSGVGGLYQAVAPLSSTELSEAVNKRYLLNFVRTRSLVFSMDISDGLTNTSIEGILNNNLAPPNEFEVGTIARILCTTLTNQSTVADVDSTKSTSSGLFLTPPSGSPGTSPAITSVSFSPVNVPAQVIQVSPRVVKTFIIQPGIGWRFQSEQFV